MIHMFHSKVTRLLFAGAVIFGVVSCATNTTTTGDLLVTVYDQNFTSQDLRNRMPERYPKEDSARIAENIIKEWVQDVVVLQQAEKYLPDSKKDFSDQLESYRQNLVVYAYERELVSQKLDTIISDQELLTYYGENIENFKLTQRVLKATFIKISPDAPKIDQAQKWFKSDAEEDRELLEEYCLTFAENYFLESDSWIYLSDFVNQVPISTSDWDNFLANNTYYKFEAGSFLYIVRLFDHKLVGDVAPLELEQEKIEQLILNKRKLELINKMRQDVMAEAHKSNKIQWKE